MKSKHSSVSLLAATAGTIVIPTTTATSFPSKSSVSSSARLFVNPASNLHPHNNIPTRQDISPKADIILDHNPSMPGWCRNNLVASVDRDDNDNHETYHATFLSVRGGATIGDENDNSSPVSKLNNDTSVKQMKRKSKSRSSSSKQSSSSSSTSSSDQDIKTPDQARKTSSNSEPKKESTDNQNIPKRRSSDTEDKTTKEEPITTPAGDKPKSKTTTASSSSSQKPHVFDEILKETDYYKILGLSKKGCSSKDIQKAYRRRAVQTHPDKTGGDRRAFDKVAEAYDVLSDDKKRSMYDRFGKKGVEQGAGSAGGAGGFASGGSAEDIFRSFFFGESGGSSNPFFNFGNGRNQQQQRRKMNRTMRYQLEVTLEDMYNGISRQVQLPAQAYNPFTGQQQQQQQSKIIDVDIPKGALDGQNIVLSGAMDMNENETPGDLIFVLKQRPHHLYTRRGYDLALRVEITLSEALCGFQKTIQHLNGKSLSIASAVQPKSSSSSSSLSSSSKQDEQQPMPIQTGDVQVLKGYGMPKGSGGLSFGDLYLQFEVKMPSTSQVSKTPLSADEQKELKRLLRKLEGNSNAENERKNFLKKNENVQYLKQATLSDFGRASGQPHQSSNTMDSEEHLYGEDQNGFSNSFQGNDGTRRYYWSSSNGASGAHAFGNADPFGFFGGSSPASSGGDENQCQQM